MGGFMQPQGHVQVLTNMLDHGMDAQRALDAPRFSYAEPGCERVDIEPSLPDATYANLRGRGHRLEVTRNANYGGGQVIIRDPESGALKAGAEPRNDGSAVAY